MPDLAGLSLGGEAADDNVLSSHSSDSVSTVSSIMAATWADVPVVTQYFALWGGRIVYTDRSASQNVVFWSLSDTVQ
jgi:hypothetical protein